MSELKYMSPMSKSHVKNLDKAIQLSYMSTCKFKHGAVIVKSGSVISVGVNYNVNRPELCTDPKTQASVHAEVAALNAARKVDLTNATIYVARTAKNGDPVMSKPCENCQKALKARGVKKVFYTIQESMDL